ncbi:MAG: hypothetical protein ACTSRZ_03390 [Promethearchaeota archaeon]
MPVITIKINQEMFSKLKKKYSYHGDISRIVRAAVKSINKGLEFSAEGNVSRINEMPVVLFDASGFLNFVEAIDDEMLQKIAVKNADSINEKYYIQGVHSFDAIRQIFSALELSNILKYKIVETEETGNSLLVYLEKCIFSPRIMVNYFNKFIEYLCKLNRLELDIEGTVEQPIYRVSKEEGSLLL